MSIRGVWFVGVIMTCVQMGDATGKAKGGKEMKRWNFDRYRNGVKMAEGIGVHKDTMDGAVIAANEMNNRHPDSDGETLVFRDNNPCVSECDKCDGSDG